MIFLADHCRFTRPLTAPGGMIPCNPSIAPKSRWGGSGGWRAIIRGINYRLLPNQGLHFGLADPHPRSHHWLIDLDRDLRPVASCRIDDSALLARFDAIATEDLRIFQWRGQWWCGGTLVRTAGGGHHAKMLLARIDEDDARHPRLVDALAFPEDAGPECWQKNWMLWPRDTIEMSDWAWPLAVRAWDGTGFSSRATRPGAPALKGWRGTSLIAPWHGGGLTLLHRRGQNDLGPDFEHRFVHFHPDWSVRAMSPPVRLQTRGVEFACGLAVRGKRVVIGYGLMDASAHLMALDAGTIRELLAQGMMQ